MQIGAALLPTPATVADHEPRIDHFAELQLLLHNTHEKKVIVHQTRCACGHQLLSQHGLHVWTWQE